MRCEIDKGPYLYHARFIRNKDNFATTDPNVREQDFNELAKCMGIPENIIVTPGHEEHWDAGLINVSNSTATITLGGRSSELKIPLIMFEQEARLWTVELLRKIALGYEIKVILD